MENEDRDLRHLFEGYKPQLSSDFQFMDRLKHNMEAVEIVKRRNVERQHRNRRAVLVAGLTGFIIGFLFSLALPYIETAVMELGGSLPRSGVMNVIIANFNILSWVLVCASAVIMALNAYDLSLAIQKIRSNKVCKG